jgi:thiosulfate reductase/polysulfide reductase chain A
VKAAGLDCDVLQQDGVIVGEQGPLYFEEGAAPVFWTDSGKIEFYSQKLAANGFDPIPTWHDDEVDDPPQGYYRLLFGRSPVHTFGRTTNNRLLSEVMDENGVWVNRKIAKRWGLENGDRVYLQNQDGVRSSFSAPVKVTDRIHPDAVYVVHGYGRKAKGLKQVFGKGIDDAELVTRYKTDPIMGGTGMNVNFVTFLRAEDVDVAEATQADAEPTDAPVSENEVAAGFGSDLGSEASFRKGVAV